MSKNKIIEKQKRYLKMIFIAVFVVSFGVVLIERTQINNQDTRIKKSAPILNQVRGDAVYRVSDYREIVASNLSLLNNIIKDLENNRPTQPLLADSVYQSLLAALVPSSYKAMHLSLVSIAKEARKVDKADVVKLRVMQEDLYKEYQWLSNLVKP